MRILMLTNTYRPHVGGVAKSVAAFEEEYRRLGHDVLVIAPRFEDSPEHEPHVIRVPALQHFNGTDFSLPMPTPGILTAAVDEFQPHIVHAHHPFFLGGKAMRLARARSLPLVFTHHTMYDQYTHYALGESLAASRFAAALAAGYANFCDAVIAPSQSVADLLRERGVETRIEVIPTGVDLGRFARGDRAGFRQRHRIPPEAFVVGHVGRLAQEKNLGFLAEALARYLASDPRAHCLIVGSGPCQEEMQAALAEFARQERLHMVGVLEGQELIDAYHAMDLFAFASQSETQGMVVTEAMAAGLPVVALDGPGVRDVVRDRANGRLVSVNHRQLFANALLWVASRAPEHQATLRKAALATAEQFSMPRMAQRALRLYEALCAQNGQTDLEQASTLARARRRLSAEWDLLSNVAHAATCALEENAPLVPQ